MPDTTHRKPPKARKRDGPKPGELGPERELAIGPTIAVLEASDLETTDPTAVADVVEDAYYRTLELVGPAGPRPIQLPEPADVPADAR